MGVASDIHRIGKSVSDVSTTIGEIANGTFQEKVLKQQGFGGSTAAGGPVYGSAEWATRMADMSMANKYAQLNASKFVPNVSNISNIAGGV